MKIALIAFGEFDVFKARATFSGAGAPLSSVLLLAPDDDIGFKRGYEVFRDMADALVIADGAEFNLKETVAGFLGTALIENEHAVAELAKRGNVDFSGALLPAEATFIPNVLGDKQGFLIDEREFTLITLSGLEKEFFPACEKYVLPYLTAKIGDTNGNGTVFKCFGEKAEADKLLQPVKASYGINYSICERNCDLTVSVKFGKGDIRAASRETAFALKDICYADGYVGLSETLFTLLRLRGAKLSVAESFTGGRLAAEIVKNSGVSAYFCEGVTAYSNESKAARLGVPAKTIEEYGAVSAKVAYSMAVGLFKTGLPDAVVATTGIAGPNGDGTGVPVGRCYIAAGTKKGIHTYKFDFSGNREEITLKGVNAALYYAVKTIKNL